MPPVGFEPTISAGERPLTYVLDCAATVTGNIRASLSEKLLTCGINLFSIKIEVILFSQLARPVKNEEILQAVKEENNILHAIK
jgi:hypothetical protein